MAPTIEFPDSNGPDDAAGGAVMLVVPMAMGKVVRTMTPERSVVDCDRGS